MSGQQLVLPSVGRVDGADRDELLDVPEARVILRSGFLDAETSDELLDAVIEATSWDQETVWMFGRPTTVPRLTAWHGDEGTTYGYSGLVCRPRPWTEPLLRIKPLVEQAAGVRFNCVLANLYRSGRDSVAWHSDDEPELGTSPIVASLSLGATRRFDLRTTAEPRMRRSVSLTHGSLLVMGEGTQARWQHRVPKTQAPVGPRVNLTFRLIR